VSTISVSLFTRLKEVLRLGYIYRIPGGACNPVLWARTTIEPVTGHN